MPTSYANHRLACHPYRLHVISVHTRCSCGECLELNPWNGSNNSILQVLFIIPIIPIESVRSYDFCIRDNYQWSYLLLKVERIRLVLFLHRYHDLFSLYMMVVKRQMWIIPQKTCFHGISHSFWLFIEIFRNKFWNILLKEYTGSGNYAEHAVCFDQDICRLWHGIIFEYSTIRIQSRQINCSWFRSYYD